MKKILLTILGQESDIISSSHYISSLKKAYPISQISIITFSRYKAVTEIINSVDNIFYINQHEISSTLRSSIYSDAFAINSFFSSIKTCMSTEWDILCNYSNDLTSSYIASMINAKEVIGTTIAKEGNPLTGNLWASYQNFAMPKQTKHFINRHLVRHEMSNIEYSNSGKRLISNPDLDSKASYNFTKIRFNNSIVGKKIIGLNIEHSFHGVTFKEQALKSLIEDIKLDDSVDIVILTKGTAKEIKLLNSLNKEFNNTIISINSKAEALPSVIKNLEIFISLENSTLLIADALNIKCIEIKEQALSQSSFLLNEGYSIYSEDFSTIKNDLSFILNQELETTFSVDKISSANKTYLVIKDDYSLLETQINGTIELEKEFLYHLTRYYHFILLDKDKSKALVEHLKAAVPKETIMNISAKIKNEVESCLKVTLNAIRNAPMAHTSKAHAQNLLNSLDQINEKALNNKILSVAFCLFEAKLENLPSGNQQKNLEDITHCLFQLKSDIQTLVNILEELAYEKKYTLQENHI